MLGNAYTSVINGIDAVSVKVEADISAGFPCFDITGNLGVAVRESRERVRMAIKNSGIRIVPARMIVNISPADLRKEGTHYDLAVAVAVLQAAGIIRQNLCENIMFIGELGLNGELRPVRGVLPMVINWCKGGRQMVVLPRENAMEASYVKEAKIIPASTLNEVIECIKGNFTEVPFENAKPLQSTEYGMDFADIHGQLSLKRAIMVAAASMHNMLMIGPPGAGKTMAAERIPAILPPMTYEQQLELSGIYSVAGMLKDGVSFVDKRCFRAPHHCITPQAMAGGGNGLMPGEVSLACHGVLFMDEFNLFSTKTVEVLRQPMESGHILIDRVNGKVEYPADFMLVAAMNPCKCGYYPDRNKCSCTPAQVRAYFGRLSRPLLDRIDVCVQVPRIKYEDMVYDGKDLYTNEYMRSTVERVFNIQKERFADEKYSLNSSIPAADVSRYCILDREAENLMNSIYDSCDLSARGYHKLLKVARTIADIDGSEYIMAEHICEASGYRMV